MTIIKKKLTGLRLIISYTFINKKIEIKSMVLKNIIIKFKSIIFKFVIK